ncbi:hypothetical protein C0995_001783 [Termitomyces sp. Mi166|nr:hypothetical protein C0995_001783 [Termitomyces sp. Mi166\
MPSTFKNHSQQDSFADQKCKKGPFTPFYKARELIPHLVNLLLELNVVFVWGLIVEGLLNFSFIVLEDKLCGGDQTKEEDGDDEDEVNNMEKSQRNMADTQKVKDTIITFMQNSCLQYLFAMITLLLSYDKSAHRFNSFNTGLLICPAKLAWKHNDRCISTCSLGLALIEQKNMPQNAQSQTSSTITSITPKITAYVAVQEALQYWNSDDGTIDGKHKVPAPLPKPENIS